MLRFSYHSDLSNRFPNRTGITVGGSEYGYNDSGLTHTNNPTQMGIFLFRLHFHGDYASIWSSLKY